MICFLLYWLICNWISPIMNYVYTVTPKLQGITKNNVILTLLRDWLRDLMNLRDHKKNSRVSHFRSFFDTISISMPKSCTTKSINFTHPIHWSDRCRCDSAVTVNHVWGGGGGNWDWKWNLLYRPIQYTCMLILNYGLLKLLGWLFNRKAIN